MRFEKLGTRSTGSPDPLRPFWSKCEGYCLRLALILYLARRVAGEATGERVDGASLRGAVELIGYFKGHARRVYGAAAVRSSGRIGNALAFVRRHGGVVNARLVRMNGHTKTSGEAEELLTDLATLGHGTLTREPRGSLVFRLHPPNTQRDTGTPTAEGGGE